MAKIKYHHGSLRNALLESAEKEIAEKGVYGFSLRACARRIGVSHAAPAHHFTSAEDLLGELTAIAYEKLGDLILKLSNLEIEGSLDQLIACANAYVSFAIQNPHFFRLMSHYESLKIKHNKASLSANTTYELLKQLVVNYHKKNASEKSTSDEQLLALWTISHGFTDLLLSGQFKDFIGTQNTKNWIKENLTIIIRSQFQ